MPSSRAVPRSWGMRSPRLAAGRKHSAAMPKRSALRAPTLTSASASLITTCRCRRTHPSYMVVVVLREPLALAQP